jgi:hypothetical protein
VEWLEVKTLSPNPSIAKKKRLGIQEAHYHGVHRALSYRFFQQRSKCQCWWFTPVIPATQEAEIRRIAVGSQPGQVCETLSRKYPSQKGLVEWLK